MRKFNVESKPGFAAPRYPDAHHTSTALLQQVDRATGSKAMVGLALGLLVMLGGHLYRNFDARPIHGSTECLRQQENYRKWEALQGLPHSFEAEVELCRSEHGR